MAPTAEKDFTVNSRKYKAVAEMTPTHTEAKIIDLNTASVLLVNTYDCGLGKAIARIEFEYRELPRFLQID